jgi:PAS domain S-box-containing protein
VPRDPILHAAPVALLLVRAADLVMLDANQAYLDLVGLDAEDVVGRHVFDVFPTSPENLGQDGDLRALMERAIRERERAGVDELRYDIPSGGDFEVRWWSVCETPILDERGEVTHLLHHTEDVTELVRTRGELAKASGRVSRFSDVALLLRSADCVDDLVQIVVEHGLRVLGADGGGLVTRSADGGWVVSSSEAFDRESQQYVATTYDSPLAGQTVARTGRRVLLRDRAEAVAFHPVMADVYALTEHTAWAFLPLVVEGRSIGALMAAWLEEQAFDDEALVVMEGFAAQCAVALDRIEKAASERRTAGLVRDLAEALQSAMLTEPPAVAGTEIAVRYRSASDVARVGGDWYDSFLQPDGGLVVVIGDVIGHDDRAAGTMSQLRGLLRALAYGTEEEPGGEPPAAVLSRVEEVALGLGVSELSSAVLARIGVPGSDGTRSMRWSNAGNPPPVLVSPQGEARLLEPSDLLLGVERGTPRQDHEVPLPPGSLLLLYTDGLVERRGTSIDRSVADLCSALVDLRDLPVEDLCDRLLERLDPHLGEDDVALVVVRT